MRKGLSWLVALFALGACVGVASAQCALSTNLPTYGFNTLPNSVRQVNVKQTGCPTTSITSIASVASGGSSTITLLGNFSAFTPGKVLVITNITNPTFGISFPFDPFVGSRMTILTANGTSATATFNRNFPFSATTVTGTATQYSLINWSESTTTGSVTAALNCASNCIPNVEVTMGSTAGHLTVSGTGPWTVSSTQAVTVTATAVDTSSSVSFPLNQALPTTKVYIPGGGYQQLYQGQRYILTAPMTGNTNHAVQWAITSQPSGGDGTLDNVACNGVANGCVDNHFIATVTGRYTITSTSIADGSASDTKILYVAPLALPSYASAPPEEDEPFPCVVDPAMTGTDYEVGPGQAYTSINAVPWGSFTGGGNTVRLHSGTYFEYMQIGVGASATQPNVLCGVPDSSGNHPVMDANGAKGPTYYDFFLYGQALVNTFPITGGCNDSYPTSCPPSYFAVWGLKLQNATGVPIGAWSINGSNVATFTAQTGANFTLTAGQSIFLSGFGTSTFFNNQVVTVSATGLSSTQFEAAFTHASGSGTEVGFAGNVGYESDGVTPFSWAGGSAGMDVHTGAHIGIAGSHMYHDSQGCATYDNADSSGWGAITFAVQCSRNYMDALGIFGNDTSHPVYFQSYGGEVLGNKIGDSISTQNSCMKDRGVSSIFLYNSCGLHYARNIDHVETQDSSSFTSFEQFIPNQYATGSSFPADGVAGYQEAVYTGVQIGNTFNDPASPLNSFHWKADHDDNLGDNDMSARYGILWSGYNTSYECGQYYDSLNSLNGENDFLTPEFVIQNNIMYCASSGSPFNSISTFTAKMKTNLMHTGQFDNTVNIYGGHENYGDYPGWTNDWYPALFPMASPIDPRITGNLTADFPTTGTLPFNATTLALVSGSAAIGAASTPVGELALYTIGDNAVNAAGLVTARAAKTDIGAIGYSGSPTVVSIAVTPNPASVSTGGTTNMTATATWSDSTTTNVTTLASWSNGGSAHFTVGSSTGVVTGVSAGSGTVTATYSSISGNATVNVSGATSSGLYMVGKPVLRGNLVIR